MVTRLIIFCTEILSYSDTLKTSLSFNKDAFKIILFIQDLFKTKNIMTASDFSLEFQLHLSEIRKLNKMYFRHLFRMRIILFTLIALVFLIGIDCWNTNLNEDFFSWIVRSLILIVVFVLVQSSLISTISKIIFSLTQKLMRFENFNSRYKFSFTNSVICVQSPLGHLTHKWSGIEKVISTKNFLFLYIKEKNGYIISISKKHCDGKKMEQLISFVENNITHVITI